MLLAAHGPCPSHLGPPLQRDVILGDFVGEKGGFGDRRQEIVFIGAAMDEEAIEKQLDTALLTDAGTRWEEGFLVGGEPRLWSRDGAFNGLSALVSAGWAALRTVHELTVYERA